MTDAVDEKCLELAEHFLADRVFNTAADRQVVTRDLARRVQRVIEDYLDVGYP